MDSKCNRVKETRIQFNVSGTLFETLETTLRRYPSTLLGNPEKRLQLFCDSTSQYFLDRNRIAFEAILFFYQSFGRLVRPPEVSMEAFEEECRYFLIPEDFIDAMKTKEGYISVESHTLSNPETLMEKIWYTFEHPESSKCAYALGLISIIMLLISVFIMCAQTMQDVRQERSNYISTYHRADLAVSFWFTLEYLARFLSSPDWRKFLQSFMNFIDLISSIPYFISLLLNKTSSFAFVRVLRMIRLIRLLQLTGSPSRLGMLRSVLISSLGDVGLLFLCLLIVIFIGGSIMYVVEIDVPDTPFTSIPQSFWWAIQTVVVLGYGDIVPTSGSGKLIASFFMIFGALTISLPVLSVVSKLVKIYDKSEQ